MTDERQNESEIGRNETRARKTPPKGGEGEIGANYCTNRRKNSRKHMTDERRIGDETLPRNHLHEEPNADEGRGRGRTY